MSHSAQQTPNIVDHFIVEKSDVQSNSDNSDFRSIREESMSQRPPFETTKVISSVRLIAISRYSYYFIRSPAIRIRRRIQLYCWKNAPKTTKDPK